MACRRPYDGLGGLSRKSEIKSVSKQKLENRCCTERSTANDDSDHAGMFCHQRRVRRSASKARLMTVSTMCLLSAS
jgi:hypothetical protein